MRNRAFAAAIAAALSTVLLGFTAMGQETTSYSYDAKGRLVKVEHSGSVNNNVVANYTYDKADNRTSRSVTGAP